MIELLLTRLARSKELDQVIVATSVDERNLPLVDHVRKLGYTCEQGSENDVLERYLQTAKKHAADVVVRITGDCPLVDPDLVDEVIRSFKVANVDYFSNVIPPTYPDGLDIEVCTFKALEQASQETKDNLMFQAFNYSYDSYIANRELYTAQGGQTALLAAQLVIERQPHAARNLIATQRHVGQTAKQVLGPILSPTGRIAADLVLNQHNANNLRRARHHFQRAPNGQRKIPCRVLPLECNDSCNNSFHFPGNMELILLMDGEQVGANLNRFRCQLLTAISHKEEIQLRTDAGSTDFAIAHFNVLERYLYEILITNLGNFQRLLEDCEIDPEIIYNLIKDVPDYKHRMRIKPGITGWAQIMGSYDASLKDVHIKLKHDFYYIDNMSILLDFKILLLTVWIILKGKGH